MKFIQRVFVVVEEGGKTKNQPPLASGKFRKLFPDSECWLVPCGVLRRYVCRDMYVCGFVVCVYVL